MLTANLSLNLVVLAALTQGLTFGQNTARESVDSSGIQANGRSGTPSISADGRFVAFESDAANLVPGDGNHSRDVFVHDRRTGITTLASVDSSGGQADSNSYSPAISADGRYVAFVSGATNLVPGDANRHADVFVRDLMADQTVRVSVGDFGIEGNGDSFDPAISADGRYVAFASHAYNLVSQDWNQSPDVFVHDCLSGTTQLVSVSSSGFLDYGGSSHPSLSADGRFVAFASRARLVPNDHFDNSDIYTHDCLTGRTACMSVSSSGGHMYGEATNPSISADGRYVAFEYWGEETGLSDVLVHDRAFRTTTTVSVAPTGTPADGASGSPSLSADGRFVAFKSFATNLVQGGSNGYIHVCVNDRLSRFTRRMSISNAGAPGLGDSTAPSISATGEFTAFDSTAANLVLADTNFVQDVFVGDQGDSLPFAFCAGDGTQAACPCGNAGSPGHGCGNSAAEGGALLSGSGTPSLSVDTWILVSSGEPTSSTSVFVQGRASTPPTRFGDGLSCLGGALVRLGSNAATAGVASFPRSGDSSISASSAMQGDPISLGATRLYQVFYRDPNTGFCPPPRGGTLNVSNALAVIWGP